MAQSKQQQALLKNKLQMPLIVRDLLVTGLAPMDDATYGLHEMMSNFKPEDAILCAAFVMKEIAAFESNTATDLTFMNMESERIIERYSARDDLAQDNPQIWSESQNDMMEDITEDLEELLDLISLCSISFEITAPKIAHVLDILEIQLQTQLMIVDEVISLQREIKNATDMPPPAITGFDAENVVCFPG